MHRSAQSAPPQAVVLGERTAGIDALLDLIDGAPVRLGAPASESIAEGYRILQSELERRPVYGGNRGVGARDDVAVGDDNRADAVAAILADVDHLFGEPLTLEEVRGALGFRLLTAAGGSAGMSPDAVRQVAAALNGATEPAGFHGGSIGEADLAENTSAALGLIGREKLLEWSPRDVLALISHNGASVGRAALATRAIESVAAGFATVGAASHAALGFSDEPFVAARVLSASPAVRGAGLRLTALVHAADGSAPPPGPHLQSPLSFRCQAQELGALTTAVETLRATVDTELRTVIDNPAVDLAGERVLHTAGFHAPELLAAVVAATHAVLVLTFASEQRIHRSLEPEWNQLGVGGADDQSLSGGERAVGRAAAARAAQQRARSSTQAITYAGRINDGLEDTATLLPDRVTDLVAAIDAAWDVLTHEATVARTIWGHVDADVTPRALAAITALPESAGELRGALISAVAGA